MNKRLIFEVDINNIKIINNENVIINSGEINVNKCIFILSEEYNDLVCVGVFTKGDKTYEITCDTEHDYSYCYIPSDVLIEEGVLEIGLYGFQETLGKINIRYSPQPLKLLIDKGSYPIEKEEPIEPTERYLKKENVKSGKGIGIEYYGNDVIISNTEDQGITNYEELTNKPSINNIELVGNKTLYELGIDQDFVKDSNYTHTDNNFTNQDLDKLNSLENFDDTNILNSISNIENDIIALNDDLDITNENLVGVSELVNEKANSSDVYNKTEVDTLLEGKQNLKQEVQLIGWSTQDLDTFSVLDLSSFLANGITKFTILFYIRKSNQRKCIKFELTISELKKYLKKITTNEGAITRICQGFNSASSIGMLVQTIKGVKDQNEVLQLDKLEIKYNFYENGSAVTSFDNFEVCLYGE